MKSKKLLVATLGLFTCLQVFAFDEAGRWSSGWGQGTSEYETKVSEQNKLYIACSDSKKVSMIATVNGKEYGSYSNIAFSLIVDGTQYDEPYNTESRVGGNNFYDMWEKLRKAHQIELLTSDGQKLTLPTQDAEKVLPSTNSKDFACLMNNTAPEPAVSDNTSVQALQPNELSVGTRINRYWGVPILQVTSRTDKLVVTDIILNRGNCLIRNKSKFKVNGDLRLPVSIAFGNTAEFYIVPSNCNMLEVNVVTDRGNVVFTFH
ncbi:hypothetical protein [uncultured Tolumonas sp.]|uniref:hypothetical protein n=1 Tax=uncultured Tolumonas sp. TaxID=263765 RepID=UPI00292DB33D|nr:hypothetical protein [uncultured Tolumonas sp.]